MTQTKDNKIISSTIAKYVYAGYVNLQSGLGHQMYKLDELKLGSENNSHLEGKTICWKPKDKKKINYFIGEIVNIEFFEDDTFLTKGTDEKFGDEEILKVMKIQSELNLHRDKTAKNKKKVIEESSNIEKMTIKQLKDFCKKYPTYKWIVKEYLETKFINNN